MMRPWILLLLACSALPSGLTMAAGDSWDAALAEMPLARDVPELNRTNAISLMLNSLKPSGEVKGMVFLPAATDEIYLVKRLDPHLSTADASLLDAVKVITNGTSLQCSWQTPFVLIHTTADSLHPQIASSNDAYQGHPDPEPPTGRILCLDADWDKVHQLTRKHLSIQLRPARGSRASWHFYRHNLVGWNLSEPEILRALTLAGKTSVRLEWSKGIFGSQRRAEFYPDTRTQGTP